MGHYASEMADYDIPLPKPEKRAIDEKYRREHGGKTHPGSFTEETTVVEFAADYDVWDSDAPRYEKEKPGDPELWQWRPERYYIYSSRYVDAVECVEHGLYIIRSHGNQAKTGRPGKVLRRTVTYGPWEEVASTEESTEGWY